MRLHAFSVTLALGIAILFASLAPTAHASTTKSVSVTVVQSTDCTTNVDSSVGCDVSVSWPSSFSDASYQVSCTESGLPGGQDPNSPTIPQIGIGPKTASGFQVLTYTSSGAVPGVIDCIGNHN
jgi:hypothetical protein